MSEGRELQNAADAGPWIATLLEKLPIYQDAVQPTAKAFGTAAKPAGAALGRTATMLARAVEAGTEETIAILSVGYRSIKDRLIPAPAEKLKGTPKERIVQPHPIVAVPAIDGLNYSASEPTLSELYLNLLATAMDLETILKAHPRFVEIIRQITPDEACIIGQFARRGDFDVLNHYPDSSGSATAAQADPSLVLQYTSIMAYDSGCRYPQMGTVYTENLCSLGVLEIWGPPAGTIYFTPDEAPEDRSQLAEWIVRGGGKPLRKAQSGGRVELTALGKRFVEACVRQPDASSSSRWSVSWD